MVARESRMPVNVDFDDFVEMVKARITPSA